MLGTDKPGGETIRFSAAVGAEGNEPGGIRAGGALLIKLMAGAACDETIGGAKTEGGGRSLAGGRGCMPPSKFPANRTADASP